MYTYYDEEEEDNDILENLDDSDEQESSAGDKLEDFKNKVEDAKDKFDDARDLVDKIKNGNGKSATMDSPTTESGKGEKQAKQQESNNGQNGNSGEAKPDGQSGTQGAENKAGSEGTQGSGSSGSGSSGSSGAPSGNGASGGSGAPGGNPAGGTSGSSAASGSTQGSAAANSTAANSAAANSTAANSAAASSSGAASGAAAGSGAASGAAAGSGAASGAAAGGAAAGGVTLGVVLIFVIVIIIIIILIIGLIAFIVDGIGLIVGKIVEFANGIWTGIVSAVVGEAQATVKMEGVIDVAEYIESMGYELEPYGFLNSNGEATETKYKINNDNTGTEEIRRKSDNALLLKRNIKKVSDEDKPDSELTSRDIQPVVDTSTNRSITHIESPIWAYLVAENRTYLVDNKYWSIAGTWNTITDFIAGDGQTTPGGGMLIMVDENGNYMVKFPDIPIIGGVVNELLFKKVKSVSIDRENKSMVMDVDNYKYFYALDGWTGKYGKSLEFLLTLHLATMSPEFAVEVAENEEFDAKVEFSLEETKSKVTLMTEEGEVITKSNYEELGYTETEWKAIDKFNGEISTYTPYIRRVRNHWYYKEIIFKDNSGFTVYDFEKNEAYDSGGDDTPDKRFTFEYAYSGTDEALEDLGLIVREVRKEGLYQTKEPKVTKREHTSEYLSLQTILLGGEPGKENTNEDYKFYKYDGTILTDGTRDKNYIIKQIKTGDTVTNVMDTSFFQYAFGILESVHTLDSEYVLRDLKELFLSLDIEVDETDENGVEIDLLNWIIPDYNPLVWDPMYNTNESALIITGFEELPNSEGVNGVFDVEMPADGTIISVSVDDEEGADKTQTVKIEFTGTDDKELEGRSMYIRGLKSSVSVGDKLKRGDVFGKTTSKKGITVLMVNKNQTVTQNVDRYLCPPNAVPTP